MPGRSGLQFCRELKSNALTELIPVIMITSMADAKHRIKGIEAGADDFLNKPVIEELRAVIKSQFKAQTSGRPQTSFDTEERTRSRVRCIYFSCEREQGRICAPACAKFTSLGVRIWYDEHQLQVGDSLRDAIERGLALSNYGIVVLIRSSSGSDGHNVN